MKIILRIFCLFPFGKMFYENRFNFGWVTLGNWLRQRLSFCDRRIYWPVHPSSTIKNPRGFTIGVGSAPGIAPNCYMQALGKITIGDYVSIGPNVGLISSNHDFLDCRYVVKDDITIGSYCWIGMNSVILPGVTLGNHVIVRAGSVVSDSFHKGYCVIGGNPAKIIQEFDESFKHLFVDFKNEIEYIGYVKKAVFDKNKEKYIDL